MLRFPPLLTKVLFLDLEYYVPIAERKRPALGGMRFSPARDDHKILGGTFQIFYPLLKRLDQPRSYWEWREGSEEGVLRKVFQLLESEWKPIEAKKDVGSIMVCGVGISHSDLPALMIRMNRYSLAPSSRVHELIYGTRQIDLSCAALCQFKSGEGDFSYPKTKTELYQKYLKQGRIDPGESIWDLYDGRNYDAIEKRNEDEVSACIAVYKAMFDAKRSAEVALQRLKRLERK